MKRGQVSVFIAIGLFIVLIIGIFVAMNRNEPDVPGPVPASTSTVEEFVSACLLETAENGILTIGLQGGYNKVPLNSISTLYSDIPYYYYKNDVSLLLTSSEMLEQYKRYLTEHIEDCLNDFNALKDKGYDVRADTSDTELLLANSRVIVKLNMPVVVSLGGEESRYSDFETSVPVRLNDVYNIANFIVTKTISDPVHIDFSLIFDLQEKYDMKIDALTYDNNVVIYVIQDKQAIVDEVPFMFLFAVKVDKTNKVPEFDMPDVLNAYVGETFYYNVRAVDRENDWVEFAAGTDLFGIHPYTGEINWTPSIEDIGEYEIIFAAADGTNIASKTVRFIIQ